MVTNSKSHFGATSTGNWTEAISQYRAIKAERQRLASYGDTPRYMLDDLDREISEKNVELHPVIVKGIIGEYEGAIQNFKKAGNVVNHEVSQEISRWAPRELLDQMGVYSARVENIIQAGSNPLGGDPTVGAQLEALYQEAQNSQNQIHQRAAGEIFRSVLSRVGNVDHQTSVTANHLQLQAKRDLAQLRTTEELQKARMAEDQAWIDLCKKRDELANVGAELGEDPRGVFSHGELAAQWRRVAVVDGQARIYGTSAVEATGIEIKDSEKVSTILTSEEG